MLRSWASECNIALLHLTLLLKILGRFLPNLPKCGSTLMNRNKIVPRIVSNGKLVYFGILKTIKPLIVSSTASNLTMTVNIDGLPLYKSSNQQFWPILVKIPEIHDSPLIISIFSGMKKPCIGEFFEEFVKELLSLSDGFIHDDKHYILTIKHFTCDLPALAFIKQIKGHSGYSSCPKCNIVGNHNGKHVCFEGTNKELRTDKTFRTKSDEDHHIGVSPLEKLPIDMVKCFAIDSMHLIYLGIMRKMINIWISGNNKLAKFSSLTTQDVSSKLLSFKSYIPYEFVRRPRSFSDIKYWKATEYRNFVLYFGVVALKDCGNETLYNNFLLLHAVAFSLNRSNSAIARIDCDYVKKLIDAFLDHSRRLYGLDFFSLNVHMLNHLPEDCKMFGNIDDFSAFDFENTLGKIKNRIRSGHLPLEQICNSNNVINNFKMSFKLNDACTSFEKPHNMGPLPRESFLVKTQFSRLHYRGLYFSLKWGNNCFFNDNGEVFVIFNIFIDNFGKPFLIVKQFIEIDDFYSYPFKSSHSRIHLASVLSSEFSTLPVTEIRTKCLTLPYHRKFVLYPLL